MNEIFDAVREEAKEFKRWSDPKRFLFEDLVVYLCLFGLALLFDPLVILLSKANIVLFPHEVGVHPLEIGKGQFLVLVFSAVQFFRKFLDWRYHR